MDLIFYPILAGLLVTLTHVPLGRVVLDRGIVFLDLAVAQIAGLGVMIGYGLHIENSAVVQLLAVSFALAGALFLSFCEKKWPDIQEALIGSIFIVTASATLLSIEHLPNAGEKIKGLLSGQIALVDPGTLIIAAVVYAAVLLIWFGTRFRTGISFYLLFAITVTTSVQIVGIYLVFATLILPALAIRKMTRWQVPVAWILAISAYVTGVLLSWAFDLPTGPVIVMCLALVTFLFGSIWVTRAN